MGAAMATKSKGDAASVKGAAIGLPPDCRIADMGELHRQFSSSLDAPQITLDGTEVNRVDTAALQLLVVYQRELEKRGHAMQWAGVSAPLYDAASQLGLAQTLALPAKKPA
jgi:phospholipid transport system transporter-binding protein